MQIDLARARRVLLEVPRNGKLAYCLLRDPRVPLPAKAGLAGTLALIASPIDFPAWIPVLGDFDMLALAVLAVKVFIEACPEEVVEEHRAALKEGEGAFDRDLRGLLAPARRAALRLVAAVQERAAARPQLLEDVSA